MNLDEPISILRHKYSQQITAKKEELRALESKLELLGEIEKESPTRGKPPLPTASVDDLLPDKNKYANYGLTEAALEAVKIIRSVYDRRTDKADVGKFILHYGYRPKGKNFGISLDQALRRLADKGLIQSTLENGRRYYSITDAQMML